MADLIKGKSDFWSMGQASMPEGEEQGAAVLRGRRESSSPDSSVEILSPVDPGSGETYLIYTRSPGEAKESGSYNSVKVHGVP